MKKLRSLLFLSVFAFGGAARADKAEAPAGDPGEQMMTIIEQLASIIDGDKANCDKMGDDVSKFATDNKDKMAKLKEEGGKLSDEQKKAMRDKYNDRMMAAMKKMGPGMSACHDNAKLKAAMGSMKPGK
jgi:hypothetical protein